MIWIFLILGLCEGDGMEFGLSYGNGQVRVSVLGSGPVLWRVGWVNWV